MTEKHYGGSKSFGFKERPITSQEKQPNNLKTKTASKEINNLKTKNSDLILAGKITSQVREFARSFIKKDMLLLEIAEKIENKIIELGAKPAFPVNLSINEIAAHATPLHNSTDKAFGLLKVDLGAHINGSIADTAFSIDLENSKENKLLIESAENSLKKAVEKFNIDSSLGEIGKIIEENIKDSGFQPIVNLSGHSIELYNLHSGINIPNYNSFQQKKITPGLYAIEPFCTTGFGQVKDSKPGGIYSIQEEKNARDPFARQVLKFILEEYKTLPFASRWIYKKFGLKGLLSLKQLEQYKILHQYAQLIEISNKPIAQAEHTILLTEEEKIITTL